MSLILDGTNGLSDIDGTAATPAIRGTDTNTGIFFPATDTIAFAEGGTEVARIDANGNVGIGTTNPLTKLHLQDNAAVFIQLTDSGDGASRVGQNGTALTFGVDGANGATERMRINSDGNLLIGATVQTFGNERLNVVSSGGASNTASFTHTTTDDRGIIITSHSGSSGGTSRKHIVFTNGGGGEVGSASVTGSATSYNTSSDYRLKENVAPMTGALATVTQLKPCTYTWKVDGSSGQGFIAHELQEVVPDCVTGEKDAVDEEGKIKPQGIDTSFLVATLTAAIQELKATVDAQAARIAALENPPVERVTNE